MEKERNIEEVEVKEMSLDEEIEKARKEGKSEAWIRLNLDI